MAGLPKGKARHLVGDGVPRRRQGASAMPSRFWSFHPSASYAGAQGSAGFTQISRTKWWTVVGKLSLRPSAHTRLSVPIVLTQSYVKKISNRSSWQSAPSQHVQENDQGRRLQWIITGHAEITAKHVKGMSVRDVDRMDSRLDLSILARENDHSTLWEIKMRQDRNTEGQRWGNYWAHHRH